MIRRPPRSTQSRSSAASDVYKRQDVSVHKEELIKFWKSSASRSGSRNFLKDSSTLQDRAFFHKLANISEEIDWIFVKILSQMYPWTRKSPVNFGSNPGPESGSRRDSPWCRYASLLLLFSVQCLIDCKKTVCESLKLDTDAVELSMGMSSDFEQAVSMLHWSRTYLPLVQQSASI